MLQKLRIKFIAINMLMVTIVVVAVLGAIGFANYQQSMANVYGSLDEAAISASRVITVQNSGNPENGIEGEGSSNIQNGLNPGGNSNRFKENDGFANQGKSFKSDGSEEPPTLAMPQLGKKGSQFIPTAIYVSTGDEYSLMNAHTTAYLDEETLDKAMQIVESSWDEHGYIEESHLLYAKRMADGYLCVAFTDEANVPDWKGLVLALVGIGLLTLAVFFVISFFFSKWALKPVEKAWEQQRQFVADASHELKTPLSVILANMSILKNHSLDSIASQSQWIESTQREAQGMQELVLDLLDLASVENAQNVDTFETLEFSEMIEGRLLQMESVVFESGLFMDYNVDEKLRVKGNKSQLERLSAILLDNACKYASPSSTITVGLKKGHFHKPESSAPYAIHGVLPKEECAILTVHNVGEAIDAEDLPHIFERFYRSDKARVRDEGHYGLGLAIAAETVEVHKGCSMVQSSAEAGTTFSIAIPLA